MTETTRHECSGGNFLFSNVDAWRLFSSQNKASRCMSIFYMVWLWCSSCLFTGMIVYSVFSDRAQAWYRVDGEEVIKKTKWIIYLSHWGFLTFWAALLLRTVTATHAYIHKVVEVKWYLKMNWFLYEMTSAPAIFITVMFWGLVLPSDDFKDQILTASTFFSHGFDALLVLTDIWITAMPIRILHFYVPLLFSVGFTVFTIIYDFIGGTNVLGQSYVYFVLDWSTSPFWSALYSGGSMVAIVILHFILYGLHKLRVRLYGNCCRHRSQSTDRDEKVGADNELVGIDCNNSSSLTLDITPYQS